MTSTEARTSRRDGVGPGAALKRAVTEAHKHLDDLLAIDMAAIGLTIAEADVLTVVHVCEYPPVPSEIADWLSLTGAGTTGRLNTLERRGLLQRLPHPTDGRSVTVHLTEQGEALAGTVVETKDAAVVNTIVDRIGPAAAAKLTAELDAVSAIARELLEDP